MMGYLLVFGALLGLGVKGYCGKRTSGLAENYVDALCFSMLRMLLCIVIGFAAVAAEHSLGMLALQPGVLAICILGGAANAAFLVGWMLTVQHMPLITVDITLTIGSLIPAVLCRIFFGEAIIPQKMAGFALILLASFIMAGYTKQTKGVSATGICLLLLTTIGDGLTGFAQQVFVRFYAVGGASAGDVTYPLSIYHLYTYVFTAVIFLIVWLLLSRRSSTPLKFPPACRKALPFLLVMAASLFVSGYLQTAATASYGIPSQVLYPILRGGCLILATVMGLLFFDEQPTRRSITGSLVAMAGILIMSLV